jgi:UDP-N-acetylmuramoylalanine--D-glutamate ligase
MTLIASSKLTIILGLGVTGLSVARFLSRQQTPFIVMDSRKTPPAYDAFCKEFDGVKCILGGLDTELLSIASDIIISPGIDLKIPEVVAAIGAGANVIGDIELFSREVHRAEVKKPIAAITGSNAKTTVTSLVGQMAKDAGVNVAIGGNIGTPALDLLLKDADLYVLELSSFQLESTFSLNATVSTVLNISEDHMDRYEALADYHRAKQKIYFGAETVIVNRADPLTQPPMAQGVSRLTFGLNRPDRHGFGMISKNNKNYLAHEFKALMPADELQLRGRHNVANCLAALAMGYALKLPINSMLETLKKFKGIVHRCQWVATVNGVDYINDSKATNIGATVAAINGFSDDANVASTANDKKIILIAGGQAKGADFSVLVKGLKNNVSTIVLIGVDAKLIELAIVDAGISDSINIVYADTLDKAVHLAQANASQNDIVLLSPACASFDMFANFEDRGNQFVEIVEGLVA